ncbi:MAG TPA: FecR domain-containing protein, partial [Acidimicrobiia bacterium]|nr:FecR domain-containing protein [Acidimicrobiia bacterium]
MFPRTQIRVAALIGMVVVLVAGCSSQPDEPGVEARTATLRILDGGVEVAAGGTGFTAGRDGQVLVVGDVVRTADGGRAAIEWFDGSVTRLERGTTFTLVAMEELPAGGVEIEGEQSAGSTYHRVTTLTEAASRFDVVTPTATASVQGTIFAVIFNADGSTGFAVFEGTVLVGAAGVPVPAGFMVVVAADGTVGEPVPIPAELLAADWIRYNQCELDAAIDCEAATLDRIELSPSEATIAAGDSQEYTVEAFNSDGES